MGEAIQWQQRMALELCRYPITVLNPRRVEWDNSKESMDQQVEWELSALEQADVICLFIDVATEARITLLELGKYLDSGKLVVSCGKQYDRYLNVEKVCKRYGVPLMETFAELPGATIRMLKEKGMELETNGDLVGDNTYVAKPPPKSKAQLERENLALQKRVHELEAKLQTS